MTWRTVVISSNSKLDLKLNYLVIRNDVVRKVHLSEISVLILESTAISITTMLLCELTRRKIKVVFCDETHNPYGELIPYSGSHDSVDKLRSQLDWAEESKKRIWAEIVKEKIRNQSAVLALVDNERSSMLSQYAEEVESGDATNREGHAAKVYFNTIFGDGFSRRMDCYQNAALNYGYAILLSAVNREIVASGYNTQLGIFHDNMFNRFNLGSDLMEPLRPIIDRLVLNIDKFDTDTKHALANILNEEVMISGRRMYLNNAIGIYVRSIFSAIEKDDCSLINFCYYESQSDEVDGVLRFACEDCR